MLGAQTQAIHDQQAAMIDSLRRQLVLMNLPPEQEKAYMEHYMAGFELQEQQLRQQADFINSQTGQVRKIRVLLTRSYTRTRHTNCFVQNVSYLMIVEVPSDRRDCKGPHASRRLPRLAVPT